MCWFPYNTMVLKIQALYFLSNTICAEMSYLHLICRLKENYQFLKIVVYNIIITILLLCCRYELYDPCTVMFFFRNKHIMIDLGTGNNNKINWPLEDKQEMIDIIETVYRGSRKGRGLVVSPKDYSTKYRY